MIPVGPPDDGILGALTDAAAEEKGLVLTEDRLKYISNRHSASGARTAGKSVFAPSEDIASLAKAAEKVNPQPSTFGRDVRVVDAGRIIGEDQNGNPTSKYTVVTEGSRIFNAYPGLPK